MGYEIIALDIDGTLTDSHRELTPRTINTLIEAQKRGKKVILASGRHNCGMRSIAEMHQQMRLSTQLIFHESI